MLELNVLPQIEDKRAISQLHGVPLPDGEIAGEGLYEHFRELWIGRGGLKPWLPRSPLDFYMWDYVKQVLSSVKIDDTDHFKRRNGTTVDSAPH
jgi:hypothetical protein